MGRLAGTDVLIAAAMAIVCGLAYGWLAVLLSQSHYGNVDNLAFDFDARRYLCTYANSPMAMGGIKHPLIVLLRLPVQALIHLGLPPRAAAGVFMAAVGGAGIGLWYLFLRTIRVAHVIAVPFALLLAVSATQLFVSMIPEAYRTGRPGSDWTVAADSTPPDRARHRRYLAFCRGVRDVRHHDHQRGAIIHRRVSGLVPE